MKQKETFVINSQCVRKIAFAHGDNPVPNTCLKIEFALDIIIDDIARPQVSELHIA